jgi:hypothetical protein
MGDNDPQTLHNSQLKLYLLQLWPRRAGISAMLEELDRQIAQIEDELGEDYLRRVATEYAHDQRVPHSRLAKPKKKRDNINV